MSKIKQIFDTAPKQFGQDDFTFRLRMGSLVNGRPMSHDTWRFTTGDPDVAETIVQGFGGESKLWETKTDENLEILSNEKRIEVILDSLSSDYVMFGQNNKPIRACNGEVQRLGLDEAKPCACAAAYTTAQEWKQAAKDGLACKPMVKATFRLAEYPDVGLGRYESSSWSLATGDPEWKKTKMDEGQIWQPPISQIQDELEALGGRAMAAIEIVGVEFQTKAGKHVSYSKPQITILGEVSETLAALMDA
jgi:hypothetical protein